MPQPLSALLSLPVQSAFCFALSSKQLFPFWKQLANCLRKPATGSFPADVVVFYHPISFYEKEIKNENERAVNKSGNLPLGSEDREPGRGSLRRGGCGLHELQSDHQRLRRR
jgi:hypothetical protein